MVFRLRLATTNDMYDVNFNRAWDAATGYNGGIFEVSADIGNEGVAGDKWYIQPLSTHLPYLGPNGANILLGDISDSRKDAGGTCTLGNFLMPFEMTVTRK